MVKKQESEKKVQLLKLSPKVLKIKVVGDSPLLMHKFSDASKSKIMDKQTGGAKVRGTRNVSNDIEEAIHKTPDGKVGFPASAFKRAIVESSPYFKQVGLNKKLVKGQVHILGNILPIKFKDQVINEAPVRLPSGNADIRYRPEFNDWSCELTIRFNETLISVEQIVNLLNYAGFCIGIGDWRMQCGGTYGMFHVETA